MCVASIHRYLERIESVLSDDCDKLCKRNHVPSLYGDRILSGNNRSNTTHTYVYMFVCACVLNRLLDNKTPGLYGFYIITVDILMKKKIYKERVFASTLDLVAKSLSSTHLKALTA